MTDDETAATSINWTGNDGRDWPEDFPHENGQYECKCMYCHNPFWGYKRRVVCKRCATKETV